MQPRGGVAGLVAFRPGHDIDQRGAPLRGFRQSAPASGRMQRGQDPPADSSGPTTLVRSHNVRPAPGSSTATADVCEEPDVLGISVGVTGPGGGATFLGAFAGGMRLIAAATTSPPGLPVCTVVA